MIPDSAGDEYPDCKPIITHFVQTKFIDSMPHAYGDVWIGLDWVCVISIQIDLLVSSNKKVLIMWSTSATHKWCITWDYFP